MQRTVGPASGATFPVGVTAVTHTATDAASNTASASFTVTVRSAAQQLADLIVQARVAGLNPYLLINAARYLSLGATNQTCALLASFTQQTRVLGGGATGVNLRLTTANVAAAVGCFTTPGSAAPR